MNCASIFYMHGGGGGIAAMRLEEGDQQSEKFQRSDCELEGRMWDLDRQ
jgi:hypothetical protein